MLHVQARAPEALKERGVQTLDVQDGPEEASTPPGATLMAARPPPALMWRGTRRDHGA